MITRRSFLKGSLAFAASAYFPVEGFSDMVSNVYISESENIRKAVRHGIDMAGGIDRYIKKNDVVAIKPNMAWARAPQYAANTNPIVVAEVVDLCYKAGAKEVYVSDNPCDNARSVFTLSEIPKYAEDAKAKVFIPQGRHFKEMNINGRFVKEWSVFELYKSADKVINIPVAKHHGSSQLTACMKNWFGGVGGYRGSLHQNLHQAIYDIATFFKPTLNVVDCTRVLLRNGPTGGSFSDVKALNKIIVATDQAAADTIAADFLGINVRDVDYLMIAGRNRYGNTNKANIKIFYEKV